MTEPSEKHQNYWEAANYCVSFIDLLGQRALLDGQGLLPSNEEEQKRFDEILPKSVGAILHLQEKAEEILNPFLNRRDSPSRDALPQDQQAVGDEMLATRIKTQRWSDGLMLFHSLGDKGVRCHTNGIYALFLMAGTICMLGLATKDPIRGAIEIGWGVELHPGELYGAAVASAYTLESEVAQYPRIVIGNNIIKLLQTYYSDSKQDPCSLYEKKQAEICFNMLLEDIDGHLILHYLGDQFIAIIGHQSLHADLYARAKEFILEQIELHRSNKNTKLAQRYFQLLNYFNSYSPSLKE